MNSPKTKTTTKSTAEISGTKPEKWGMCVEREIRGFDADEVWSVLGKFGGLKKWVRSVEVCELVAGEEGEPGCVRYLAGGGTRPDGSPERWVKEMLLEWLDTPVRSFTYNILDSSYGMRGYLATISVMDKNIEERCLQPAVVGSPSPCAGLPLPPAAKTCVVRWSFIVDPVVHSKQEDVIEFFSAIFFRMMSNLESALSLPYL